MTKLRRAAPLLAVLLAVVACDFTRKGSITLAPGSSGIPLAGKSGPATLVAGGAEVTIKKGSGSGTIAIKISQPSRPDAEFEAKVSKGYESGNFTLKGSEIGQPVDMASTRGYTVTGPRQGRTEWSDEGMRNCRVDVTWDPCREDWTISFKSVNGVELGVFASQQSAECNVQRGFPYACMPNRDREPRIPDFPRGPHGPRSTFYNNVSENGVSWD